MSVDTISDFLTIIRNGLMVSKRFVVIPYSKIKHSISNILKDEGFIQDVVVEGEGVKKVLKVFLKYVDGERVIHEIQRVSSPGRRVYVGSNKIKPVKGGLGVLILSTSKGLMTDKKAKFLRKNGDLVGGEIICTVW